MGETAAYLREVSEDQATRERLRSIRVREWDDHYRQKEAMEEYGKNIARKMIARGIDASVIAEDTGLPIDTVLKLQGEE